MWKLHIACFAVLCLAVAQQRVVEVNITRSDGHRCQVLGTLVKNWLGEPYYAFRGIPYAQPPVGILRFRDPKPLEQLPAIIDARYDGHDCPSIWATNASENCLTLNVYTSRLAPTESVPVLVFIHPGGLYLGSGLSSFLGPQYLLTKSLVLVTFNYRLGTLGYLNVDTANVPGNAGFKDQARALHWVHTHIASFGGNPLDITLMGYSAGALSVGLHVVSPMTSQLFQKAIVMSGSMPPQAAERQLNPNQLALKQARLLGCNLSEEEHSPEQLIECFNQHNGTQMAATLRRLFDFGKDNPMYLWLPMVEHALGQNRFLNADFYDSLRAGNFSRKPLLIGYANGEFCTSAAEVLQNTTLLEQLQTNFTHWAPKIFMYEPNEDKSQALRQHYFNSSGEQSWKFERLCDLFTDALIRFGAHRLARLADAAQAPVYGYRFEYRGQYSNLAYASQWGKERVEHLDDLMYLFRMAPHNIKPSDVDARMVKLYVNFIYDFMRNGELRTAAGERRSYPESYALITDQIVFVSGEQFNEAEFWEKLFP